MRRLSIEEVRNFVEKQGYTLLSTDYKNTRTPILVQCPHHHPPYYVCFSNFYNGTRCPVCGNALRSKKGRRKWTKENIEAYLNKYGYKLNRVYMIKNSRKLVDITCPYGHTYSIYWSDFLRGRRCGICSRSGKKMYDYKKIADFYLSHNRKQTAEKFNIDGNTVSAIFHKVYHCSRRQYLATTKSDDNHVH